MSHQTTRSSTSLCDTREMDVSSCFTTERTHRMHMWSVGLYPKEPGKKSVTVMISDSCPCQHPNPSNERWCCGDRTHLDLSYAAFDQIALRHRGVVDLKVRPADCSKQGTVAFYQ